MSGMLVSLKKFMIATLAPSMRSPSGITGWFARRLMRSANPASTAHAIRHRLDLKASDVFVELGAGEGAGLLALTDHARDGGGDVPSTIHLVEISDAMRGALEGVVREVREDLANAARHVDIKVHGQDCRSMPYLRDGSVDTIFAMNVVYFLDPLTEYLREIHRVLKPGVGEIVWGCKFDKVPKDNREVFVNVEEAAVVAMMESAGFRVSTELIDVVSGLPRECSAEAGPKVGGTTPECDDKPPVNDMRNYVEIRGRKTE